MSAQLQRLQTIINYLEEASTRLLASPLTRDQENKLEGYYKEFERLAEGLATTAEAGAAASLTVEYQRLKAELYQRMNGPTPEQVEMTMLYNRQDRTMKLLSRLLDALEAETNPQAIKSQLSTLSKQMEHLDNVDTQIMETTGGYNQQASDQYTNMVVRYSAVTSAAMARLGDQGRSQIDNNIVTQTIKLPPLHVPKFSGRVQKWHSFKDLFNLLINQEAVQPGNLSNIKKILKNLFC